MSRPAGPGLPPPLAANDDRPVATRPRAACSRCGRTERLVQDDGPNVRWICVVAWGRYARTVTAGATVVEPGVAARRRRAFARFGESLMGDHGETGWAGDGAARTEPWS